MPRRLSAVMFTDVVGYTALMQDDEEAARVIRLRHREALEAAITAHGGELVQYLGDGSLSTFPSAVRAVSAAVEVQQALGEDVPLRIGIHQGEIAFDDQGIYGDSVNVASRVMGLGTAGSVLVSEKAQDELKNQRDFSTASLGRFELKNVKHPMAVHAVRQEGLDVPTREDLLAQGGGSGRASAGAEVLRSAPATAGDSKCVAVLPLQNIGGDPENDFFADGLTEDIIAHLSHVEELRVISRTSVMRFKQTTASLGEIAAALNVGSVLEGSVRRAGERLRVVVQLIDARTDEHLWAETYDREMKDVFAIQSEIALNVADALRASLSPVEEAGIRQRPTESMDAHDLYLLGKHHWWSFREEPWRKAKGYFEHALALDADYAPAHAGLALTYLVGGGGGMTVLPMAEAMPKAKAAALKAISLDPRLGEGYGTLALVHAWFEWDCARAEEMGRKGVEVEPSSSIAWGGYAYALAMAGKSAESVEAGRRFAELDPLAALAQQNLAGHLFNAGRADEARLRAQRSLELDPSWQFARTLLADIALWQGDPAEALALIEPLLGAAEESSYIAVSVGAVLSRAGKAEQFREVVGRLESWAEEGRASWVGAAVPYIWSGDHARALDLLEKVPDQRPPPNNWPAFLGFWALLDPVRDDPRFQEVLRKMGLA